MSGALERSLDVAAVLEMRGYGAAGRARRAQRPLSRHDLAFAAAAFGLLALAIGADSGGLAAFHAYPLVSLPLTPRLDRLRGPRARARARPVRRPPGDRAMSVLRFERVSYRYPGTDTDALREVSFTLAPGEFCVLAGLSGSGKSTLLRAAAGLVPHFHGGTFSGELTVGTLDSRLHSAAEIGALAGTVLQDPETQVIMSSVRAELALALENRGHGGTAVARAVEEAALALGIAHLLDRPTAELSGGELQRVALAAALVARPPLVLLDEPTSQLDPVAGDELIWQLRRLNQESDTAVLLIEHRLERCLAAADRVIALSDGEIVCDSDPAGFLEWAARNATALQTPGARMFEQIGLLPPPTGVKQARAALRRRGLLPVAEHAAQGPVAPDAAAARRGSPRSPGPVGGVLARLRARNGAAPALSFGGVWHELRAGPAILRGVDLRVQAGESVVLMGRNGAGKSTLLRHAAGLLVADARKRRERRQGRAAAAEPR